MRSIIQKIFYFFSSGKRKTEERRKIKRFRQILESAYINGNSTEIRIPGEGVKITIEPSAMPEILKWCEEWLE